MATSSDAALAAEVAEALEAARAAAGLGLPDPARLLEDAWRLLAHWDAECYGACCTDDPAYRDLRRDLADIAHVGDVLLVDTLTATIATASGLPRSVTRPIATFVVKHGFETGRGLACPAWGRFVGAGSAAG